MSDPGTTIEGALEVNDHEGRVVITVRQTGKDPVYVALDPGQALEGADMIAKASYHAKYGKERPVLVNLGDMIIEQKRQKLNNRLLLMIRTMLADKRSNQYMVKNLVDACMAELT